MKKIKYLLIAFFAIALTMSSCKKDDPEEKEPENLAPFTIKVDGEELINNAVKSYNTLGESANMELAITNNTSEDINLRIALVSKTAPDTAGALICFDVCYPSIIERTVYPINASYTLASGATSESGKAHIQYNDTNFGSVEYVFEVFQVDENLIKKEDGITFTYKYDAP
jgi:hypothetical protein